MQLFVKTLSGRTVVVTAAGDGEAVAAVKARVAAACGVPPHAQRLLYAGKLLEDGGALSDYDVCPEATLHLCLALPGGAKKRKKKTYNTPKRVPHKHKTVKLAVLKYYRVDGDGTVVKLRKECPTEGCGAGVFLAHHFDRYVCGRCHVAFAAEGK